MKSLLAALLAVLFLFVLGCKSLGLARATSNVLSAQTPGVATGAGGTLTAPGNAAAPSTQTSRRTTVWANAPASARNGPLAAQSATDGVEPAAVPAPVAAPPAPPPGPAPLWTQEETTTTIGQHQDAAAILKVATTVSQWGRARLLGILLIIAGVFGLALAHNNPEGYPVICWKITGIGLFLAVFDPSPWWLLLLLIPAGFYLAQKLNLLRLPGLP